MPRAKRKTDEQLANDMARSLLPAASICFDDKSHSRARKTAFVLVDVQNHSEADQRHMTRSGQKKTIRRKTHIQKLVAQRQLTEAQGAICKWYADQHEQGFATVGCTANYGGAGGGGFGSYDLLARYQAQAIARNNYTTARLSLGMLASLFERVVIHETPIAEPGQRGIATRLRCSLSLAIQRLDQAIGHLVEMDA